MARKVSVEIVGDSASLERAFRRSARSAERFQRTIRNTAGALGIAFGGRAVVGAIEDTVKAASNLNEMIGQSKVVFGDSAAEVQAWSKTTTDALGISERQALQTASSFGALFRPIGLTGAEAARQATKLTQLGGDLASFYDTSVADALTALRSGVVGEAEPLRRYGVLLSEARVQAQAMADTGKRVARSLTPQEKALARLEIIYRDSVKAQGDFARSSGRVAGQAKIAQANIDDLRASLGQELIPTVTDLVSRFNDWIGKTDNQEKLTRGLHDTIVFTTDAIEVMAKTIGGLVDVFNAVKDALQRWNLEVKQIAVKTALEVVEPFSHLPARFGQWARDAKASLQDELGKTDVALAGIGRDAGATYGRGFRDAFRDFTEKPLPGAAAGGAAPLLLPPPRPRGATRRGATAAQRNTWWDAMIGRREDRVQDIRTLKGQLAEVQRIADLVRGRLAQTGDPTRRLTLQDKLVDNLREQRSLHEQITDAIKAGNQALKDRAEAIKSALLDRLQQRQTDILNKRALADAKEQLRIARQIGGPRGILEARRGVQDVQFDMLRARLERAPATLRGGQFALGGVVTINVHGVTDPDAVARKVAEVLQKRRRRTTTQTRGPTAGTATSGPVAGAH